MLKSAQKTLKSSVITFFVNFRISPCQILPTGVNRWHHS